MPEIPADLSALSDEELAALEQALIEFGNTLAGGDLTPEVIAQMQSAADGAERVRSTLGERVQESERLAAERDAALARLRPAETPPPEGQEETPPAEGIAETPEGEPEGAPDAEPLAAGAQAALLRTVTQVLTRLEAHEAERAAERAAVTAAGGDVRVPSLAEISRAQAPQSSAPEPIRATGTIVASAGVDGYDAGQTIDGPAQLLDAMLRRADNLPIPRDGQPPSRALFASVHVDVPEERMLRPGHDADNWRKIAYVVSQEAITAAGGSCVPYTPYYDIMTIASAARPVRDSLPGFGTTRGGVNILPPPQLAEVGRVSRVVTDGATTSGSPTVTSATAAFNSRDVGASVAGTGIPAGAQISAVGSATSVTLTANATATATGVTLTITRQGAVGYITQAADAASLGALAGSASALAARKPCLHVTCPSPVAYGTAAISRCLEFGNFQARAYPEQEPAWLQLVMAMWAIEGETRLLDAIAAASTAVTTAQFATLGAARLFPTLVIRAAAEFRQFHRMTPETALRVWAPAYLLDLMAIDLMIGSGYEQAFYSEARAQVAAALRQANVNVTWYLDSPTGKGQYFTGANSRTVQAAGAAQAFPDTVFWYMSHEGAFLYLDEGELDFGVVRDSVLNARNDYQVFSETFEGAAYRGLGAWEFASALDATGAAAPASASLAGSY